MSTLKKSLLSAGFAALALAAGLGAPAARADDTEVFFTPVSDSDKPNILFILDSSATMGGERKRMSMWVRGKGFQGIVTVLSQCGKVKDSLSPDRGAPC